MKQTGSFRELFRRLGTGAAVMIGVLLIPATCRSFSVNIGTLPSGASTPGPSTIAGPLAQAALPTPTLAPAQTVKPADPPPTLTPTSVPTIPSFAPQAALSNDASGEILKDSQRDSYEFDGDQGQFLDVRLQNLGGSLFAEVELLDPSGVDEVPWRGTYVDNPLLHKLVSSGHYEIRVRSFVGTGPYAIAWTLDRFGQLADRGQVNSEITAISRRDFYKLDGRQGQTLRARVQRTSGVSLQPWIKLQDPNGADEATANSFSQGDVTLQTKLASTGTYIVVIGGDKTGPYQVNVSLI